MKKIIIILSLMMSVAFAQQVSERNIVSSKPIVTWGSYLPGPALADSFKQQDHLFIPKHYTLKKAIVYFSGANFSTVEKYNIYSSDLSPVKDAITRCVPGTVVYIEKILVNFKNAEQMFLSNAGFILY